MDIISYWILLKNYTFLLDIFLQGYYDGNG